MDYLNRMIKYVVTRWPFQFHTLCKATRLNHLVFANDLLMFCKGNAQSIMLLLRAFSSFSQASGLTMNTSKSEVYYNGVGQQLKEDIHQATGFVKGSMPFRYLGVPIQAGRLTKTECNILSEKMVSRIRSLGVRKLSYTFRVVLINSVLNTLYSYRASIFLILKSAIKRIEAICRNYLWDGTVEYHRVPLIAWEKVTLPKDEGGLGIKRAHTWNYATIVKLVDWIYGKGDRLWIRWVNQIYLKGEDWHDYCPTADVTWSWKNICKVKELMKNGYTDGQWTADHRGYSIRNGYECFRTHQPKQDRAALVWNNWNIPKHALIVWIIMHNGLNVKDKLFKIGYCNDDRCTICDSVTKTQDRLFFRCSYSQQIIKLVEMWCGFPISVSILSRNGLPAKSCLKQKVHYLVWSACYYQVWTQRNNARINSVLLRPFKVADQIIDEGKRKIRSKIKIPVNSSDQIWLTKWGV
ncbi:uncharacterized protein LOC141588431 [Silene latifolia]|uniref:uncharacterized protein LOC141588431 n=1 Tax=Silene latifolia TaxID=37657 RepID=UPI003D789D6D